MTKIVIKEKRC